MGNFVSWSNTLLFEFMLFSYFLFNLISAEALLYCTSGRELLFVLLEFGGRTSLWPSSRCTVLITALASLFASRFAAQRVPIIHVITCVGVLAPVVSGESVEFVFGSSECNTAFPHLTVPNRT